MIQMMVRAALALIAGGIAMTASAQNYSDGYKFLQAVRERDGNTVTSMIEAPGSRVINSRDISTGESALQIVIARQDLTWLGFLLSKGANPNQQDDDGDTPMLQAVEEGFSEGVRRLITAKANINLANRSGETPLIRAVQKRDPELVRLLIANGADPDRRDVIAGMSARDYAKANTRMPILLELIEKAETKPAKGVSGPVL
ncbi:ankyrin repeat domain-containing protein [Sphingomonas gilva]|uniref:Ankyrin repeat domain-containing protein n=2 Tax=Sphingomonas gilva TaxID=2305907 RepID=A0A396RN74_9SPHN|nr:ankyrin repeat domain-containing protein [Sphingomonas gilva]